nr:PhoD-like phosphatase N-terminal domain-containing protein [Actinophytocola sp.]
MPAGSARASTRPVHGGYPFTLAVASGGPTPTGMVLWTRLVPRLFEPTGGMPTTPVTVDRQVAADERFRRVVREGAAWALPRLGHSVHVEVEGLAPDRAWFHRFRYRRDTSPVGRTRTAPVGGGGLTLAVASFQAWYEHQPVRAPARPGPGGPRVYRAAAVGQPGPTAHARRPAVPLGAAVRLGRGRRLRRGLRPVGDDARHDPGTLALQGFGRVPGALEQPRQQRHARPARPRRHRGRPALARRLGRLPSARNRLIEAWARHRGSNPVAFTGDWHSTFANDFLRDFDEPASPVVASEIVGTSISSNGDGEVYGPYCGPMIEFNPHIRFFDGDRRGYLRCRVDRDELRADLRVVSTVSRQDAPESTYASFVVEDARPGPRWFSSTGCRPSGRRGAG